MTRRSTTPPTILVVEDSPEVQAIVRLALSQQGWQVTVCADGYSALDALRLAPADVVVLDIGLPDINGIEVCREIRRFSDCYVVMLTARSDEVDRLVGLSVGADDYIVKPFSPRELTARVQAMLRRPRIVDTSDQPAVEAPQPISVDTNAREVRVHGHPVDLTRREFDLLAVLASQPRRVLTRQQLIESVWGPNWYGEDHILDVNISNLRRKLEANEPQRVVRTVRGVGYRYEPISQQSANQPLRHL